MNLLLLDRGEVVDGMARVDGRRARHLIDVLRIAPGHELRAGIVGGGIGVARVTAIDATGVVLAVRCDRAPPAPTPVDLIVAMPRPKVLSRLLQYAAAYAVRRIDLVNAWRVEKSYLGSSRLDAAAIDVALRLGAEQGTTTHLPSVAVHRRLMEYLDESMLAVTAPRAQRLLADARSGIDLERAVRPDVAAEIVLAIGPEGGWIAREIDSFVARGFTVVSLGTAVLRVEVAVVAALAQLALLRRLDLG